MIILFLIYFILIINHVNCDIIHDSEIRNNSINLNGNNEMPKKSLIKIQKDLIIVFDRTVTMHIESEEFQKSAKKFVKHFNDNPSSSISNYILVKFSDPIVNDPIKTRNGSYFLELLSLMSIVGGGGDCPDMCYTAIESGLNVARDNSYMFVFTNSWTKNEEKHESIKMLAFQKRIKIYFFATGYCKNKDNEHSKYRDIATSSLGLFFDIDPLDINDVR